MKIISWNVNGIRAIYQKNLLDFVNQERPDVLCLQETKAHPEQLSEDIKTLHYFSKSYWSSASRKGYSGVATFLNPFCPQILNQNILLGIKDYDQEGRVVFTQFDFFSLYNIYFPNGGSGETRHQFKQKFLKDLIDHMTEQMKLNRKIMIVGDYNIAHTEMDIYDPVRLSGESGFLPEERAWFDQFLNLGFIDTFRHFHPHQPHRYSWWSYRELARVMNKGWRIDYICVTKDLIPFVKSADILDRVEGSDHAPLICELNYD